MCIEFSHFVTVCPHVMSPQEAATFASHIPMLLGKGVNSSSAADYNFANQRNTFLLLPDPASHCYLPFVFMLLQHSVQGHRGCITRRRWCLFANSFQCANSERVSSFSGLSSRARLLAAHGPNGFTFLSACLPRGEGVRCTVMFLPPALRLSSHVWLLVAVAFFSYRSRFCYPCARCTFRCCCCCC